MAYSKEIKQEIASINTLKVLTEAYGEIAAARMMKIRDKVIKNREFLSSIHSIFMDALMAHASKLSSLVRSGALSEGGRVTFLAHNGKTVAVLISANTGLYGEVVKATFKRFIQDIRKSQAEVTIIGRLGKNLFLEEEPNRPFTYFELPDYGIDVLKLSEAIKHLVQYEEIKIYHGRYFSVITQKPEVLEISAGTPISGKIIEPKVKYIFEPSVEKILMFFETQIFASLFDQALRESQLAKFASRILAMDKASQNITKRLNQLKEEQLKFSHKLENKKQINSLMPVFILGV